ncbi:MAG: DUF5020 family protein [Bacteroidales bacterium]|nr:DUF5020 family protein [Bacteroidales bacterium]
MKKYIVAIAFAMLALAQGAKAQTNLQTLYDFDRGHFTTTLEMFKSDNWGNTFFFVDYDYAEKNTPSGTYMEIARCFNFWQDSKLGALSLQAEYNGGLGIFGLPVGYGGFAVNSAFLGGLDYFLHSADFSNTLNLKVLYKDIRGMNSDVPMQFTAVWGMDNLLGVSGLRFSGFIDFWWEGSTSVMISEPQLWYNIGQHIGVDNLNIGGEIEFSNNFAGYDGFAVRPCIGTKWNF